MCLDLTLAVVIGWISIVAPPFDEQAKPAEESPPPAKIETLEKTVQVVGPDGMPVADATVRPYAMRAKLDRGSHYGWVESRHGPIPKVQTDAQGLAVVEVPKYVVEKLEIGAITLVVDHPDFVTHNADQEVDGEFARIELQNGYRIALTGRDAATGQPIKEDLYAVMSGYDWSFKDDWKLAPSGFLVSRVFGHQRSSLRLVHLPVDGPPKFSKLLTASRPDGGDRVLLRDVELDAGTRVEGTLDADVPRPIRNGRVVAFIAAGEDADESGGHWMWNDVTHVKEDGTFVFESLPEGEILQLIAICDGWISRTPDKAQIEAIVPWNVPFFNDGFFTYPQVFPLVAKRITPQIIMEPAATCEVKVLQPDGKPLAGARVGMSPNHAWFRGGSTILASGHRSADILRRIRHDAEFKFDFRGNDFSTVTNEQGVAIIRNLHGKTSNSLDVGHDRFEQPVKDGSRTIDVDLAPGKTTRVTIKMQPAGTQTLGDDNHP